MNETTRSLCDYLQKYIINCEYNLNGNWYQIWQNTSIYDTFTKWLTNYENPFMINNIWYLVELCAEQYNDLRIYAQEFTNQLKQSYYVPFETTNVDNIILYVCLSDNNIATNFIRFILNNFIHNRDLTRVTTEEYKYYDTCIKSIQNGTFDIN